MFTLGGNHIRSACQDLLKQCNLSDAQITLNLDLYVNLVSSPGRDSRDIRSSRLEEATQKALGTNALLNWFRYHLSGSFPTFIQYLQNRFLNH